VRASFAQVAVASVNSLEERVKGGQRLKQPPTTVADFKDAQGLWTKAERSSVAQ